MGKNLIPIIAKELGVEIDEEFKIAGSPVFKYRFKNDKIEAQYTANYGWEISMALLNQLGGIEIIKLPFEPQDGEYYWTYQGDDFCIVETDWMGLASEYCKKACGCIFRTEAEAIKARPAKYKELTGKEWGV